MLNSSLKNSVSGSLKGVFGSSGGGAGPTPPPTPIPKTVPGLELFLKIKNDPAYLTFSGSNPSLVETIIDNSDNGRDFTQLSSSSQAEFQASSAFNSKPGLLFANDSYTCTKTGFVSNLATTMAFFVIRPGTVGSNGFFYQEPSGGGQESYYSFNSSSFRINRFGGTATYSTPIANTNRILRVKDGPTPTNRSLHDYGVQIGSNFSGGSTLNTSANPIIGKRNTSNPYPGTIHEVLIYNRVLTAEEITTIEDYLLAEWGAA